MSDRTAAITTILLVLAIIFLVGYSYLRGPGGLPNLAPGTGVAIGTQPPVKADETAPPGAMPACICHSKNPAMVKMHDVLTGEDCASCHSSEENLMDPKRGISDKQTLEKRKKNEAICAGCHRNDTAMMKQRKKGKTKISNALFCPKCKKQLTPEDKECGDCDGKLVDDGESWACTACGPLIDINKIAAQSREKPSNDICVRCHYDTRSLTIAHDKVSAYNKSIATVKGGLSNCLACHKSHNQCGGCHF